MKCKFCRKEITKLKYGLFCPECLRAIPELIYKNMGCGKKKGGKKK